MVRNPPATAGDISDVSSIPGSGRSPGEGHGKSLQYSCLEYPMDRGNWGGGGGGAMSPLGHTESDMTEVT